MTDDYRTIEKQRKRSRLKNQVVGWSLASPYIVIFVIFTLIPIIMGFVFSFMKYNPYKPEDMEFIGLENFLKVFNTDLIPSKAFWDSFVTMLLFACVTVPTMIVIPLTLAYLINMQPPGYKLFRALIYLPSVVSVSIMGIIFSNMFANTETGLINAWFGTNIQWLSGEPLKDDWLRWLVMLIATIWWQTGTNFVILSGALRDIPKSLYEACEMDGGGRWRTIMTVTLPGIKASLSLCLFTTLIGFMNLYGQPTVLNDMGNVNELVSPMMFIQKYLSNINYAKQTGYLCACALVFGLVVMAVSLVQQYFTRETRKTTRHAENAKCFIRDQKAMSHRDGGAAV